MTNTMKFRLIVGVVILLLLVYSFDFSKVPSNILDLDLSWIGLLLAFVILVKILKASRWLLLLKVFGIWISWMQCIYLYFVGNLVGTITPAGLGNDVYRAAGLRRFEKSHDVISTLIVERIIGIVVLCAAVLICIPFAGELIMNIPFGASWNVDSDISYSVTVIVILCFSAVSIYIVSNPSIREKAGFHLRKMVIAFESYVKHPMTLISVVLLTIGEIFFIVCINIAASRALGIEIGYSTFFIVIPLIQFLIRLPVSPQAIGIQEGLYIFTFTSYGYTAADGLSVSLLLRAIEIILIFIPGFVMFIFASRYSPNP